jgi:hypothetical protein
MVLFSFSPTKKEEYVHQTGRKFRDNAKAAMITKEYNEACQKIFSDHEINGYVVWIKQLNGMHYLLHPYLLKNPEMHLVCCICIILLLFRILHKKGK